MPFSHIRPPDSVSPMGRAGKPFERLVGQIELLLLHAYGIPPGQVRSVSPYYVRGCDSGELREVDATLFVNAGPRELFVAIECRDHKRRQGAAWIEQLVTKRKDIGAHSTVAVARNGFTRDAVRLARTHNIQLFSLSEWEKSADGKSPGDIRLTVSRPRVLLRKFEPFIVPVALGLEDPFPELEPGEGGDLIVNRGRKDWIDRTTGELVSLEDILAGTLTWDFMLDGARNAADRQRGCAAARRRRAAGGPADSRGKARR